jgi:hypothetical protein
LISDIENIMPTTVVDYSSLAFGATFGKSSGAGPGSVAFVERDVTVSLDNFVSTAFTTFAGVRVESTAMGLFLSVNNIALVFDFTKVGFRVRRVFFEAFSDLGGIENFSVNGGPRSICELTKIPPNPAAGVYAQVTSYSIAGGVAGAVALEGDIRSMLIAGQELSLGRLLLSGEAE